MPNTYRILGQSAPNATTLSTLYTVPSATQAVVSTIVIANRAASSATYRIAIRPSGAAIDNAHYIAFDTPIGANDSISLTLGITLGATDVISVYGSTANFTFSAFGSQITA